MIRSVFVAFAAVILSSAVFAQSGPEIIHGKIEVRTKKYKATYYLPLDPAQNPEAMNDPKYQVFFTLSREEQLKFLERRQSYINRLAQLLTRSSVAKAGQTGLAKDGTLIDWLENSKILRVETSTPQQDTLEQWWEDQRILEGGGPWGVRTFPSGGTKMVQKFLGTIDDLLWNDARNIATGQDSGYMMGTYIAFGPSLGKYGFYIGAGVIPSIVIDRENQRIRFKLHLHSQTKDYDPVGGLAFGLDGALQFMAGPYLESHPGGEQTGLRKYIVEGKMWKLPAAPVVYIYSKGPDQTFAGRTGLLFSQATISLPMTLYAAAGGPQAALLNSLPVVRETAGAMAHMWAETLGASLSTTLGGSLQASSMLFTSQSKFWDFKIADISFSYGENSIWKNFIYDPINKAWKAAKSAVKPLRSDHSHSHFTCLDLGNL
jgi:hypothetical protein